MNILMSADSTTMIIVARGTVFIIGTFIFGYMDGIHGNEVTRRTTISKYSIIHSIITKLTRFDNPISTDRNCRIGYDSRTIAVAISGQSIIHSIITDFSGLNDGISTYGMRKIEDDS